MTNESGGVFIGADKRSKHIPHNKTKDEDLQKVRQHIESFPAVEGHSNLHTKSIQQEISRRRTEYTKDVSTLFGKL